MGTLFAQKIHPVPKLTTPARISDLEIRRVLPTVVYAENFEQYELDEGTVGDTVKYLKENDTCDILVAENQAIGLELPIFVALAVTQTDPGVRGDTASGGSKPATVETGATVQVPLFVELGDVLKIDTRTDTYVERV